MIFLELIVLLFILFFLRKQNTQPRVDASSGLDVIHQHTHTHIHTYTPVKEEGGVVAKRGCGKPRSVVLDDETVVRMEREAELEKEMEKYSGST